MYDSVVLVLLSKDSLKCEYPFSIYPKLELQTCAHMITNLYNFINFTWLLNVLINGN